MLNLGVDLNDKSSVEEFNASMIKRHCKNLNQVIREKLPNAEIFFNGTTALEIGANFRYQMYKYNTTQDLEDLPTTWGGYDKLPIQAKFFINAGFPITAMSGKFHTDWGEFGGFKHPNALKYEAALMVASGANCNFGDQLHPSATIDLSTYENIKYAFDYVKRIEEFVFMGNPFQDWEFGDHLIALAIKGFEILLENHIDFM